VMAAAQTRDNEFRASYPGWETTANNGDSNLNRLQGPPATRENLWTGNRGGYEDLRAQRLLDAYYSSIRETDLFQATRALTEFVAAELPIMPLLYTTNHVGVRKGVKAMDDVAGGAGAGAAYGTYTRNAHLWEVH